MNKKFFEQFILKFSQINPQQKNYILVGCVILIFILDVLVFMRPQFKAMTKINQKIRGLSRDMKTLKSDAQRIDELKGQLEQLKTEVAQVSGKIFSKESVPLILENLSRLANENGMKIDNIKPLSDQERLVSEKKGRSYLALPIELQAKAGYHNLGKFLNRLERGEIFFKIKDFTVTPTPDFKTHNVQLTLETIVYEETQKP